VFSYDHANIWLNLSVFWGDSFLRGNALIFFMGQTFEWGTIITLSAEKILERGFHIVTRVSVVKEASCQAHEHSLEVRYFLSNKEVVMLVSILSK
jgi:hypothetical protein